MIRKMEEDEHAVMEQLKQTMALESQEKESIQNQIFQFRQKVPGSLTKSNDNSFNAYCTPKPTKVPEKALDIIQERKTRLAVARTGSARPDQPHQEAPRG